MGAEQVYIVDDDPSVRSSVRNLLSASGLSSQQFSDARSFLSAVQRGGRGCVVLDVGLPDLDGLELQRQLVEAGNHMPIIFITARGDIPMSVRAMKQGAVTFLSKPFHSPELLAAVRDAIDRDRAARVEHDEVREIEQRYATLTPREKDVMRGVVAGLLNKQIAGDLGTKEATVKEQRAHVMTKMQAGSVADLVRMADRLES